MATSLPSSSAPLHALLTRIAFALALVLVIARATIHEMLRDPIAVLPGVESPPRNPGPAASLALNLLFCLPALLILLRRVIDPQYVLRLSWLHGVMLALGTWAFASTLWASDQFAASVSSLNFAAALALLWSMTQLVRSWKRFRIVIAVLFGLLLVYVAAGLTRRLVDYPDQVRSWHDPNSPSGRQRYLQQNQLSESDFLFQAFERRLLSGEIAIFSSSPNTYAAALVMLTLIAGGLAAQRLTSRDDIPWVFLSLLPVPAACFVLRYTYSRTAMLSLALGSAALLLTILLHHRLATLHRRLYSLGAAAFLLLTFAFVGHGLYHGHFPEKSITFRWQYWIGAARIVQDHPVLGVGWGNFGLHYLSARLPEAPEEVKDPHNLFVRATSELGIIGGLLMAIFVFRLAWELTRPIAPPEHPTAPPEQGRRGMISVLFLAVAALATNVLVSVDLARGDAYMALELLRRIVGLIVLACGIVIGAFRSLAEDHFDTRPAQRLLHAAVIAAGVFLLHNLLDFALFEPAPLAIFALLTGAALGLRQESVAGKMRKNIPAVVALSIATLAWILAAGAIVVPTAIAEFAAAEADRAIENTRFDQAVQKYREAFEARPSNGDYAYRAAQASLYLPSATADSFRQTLARAEAANPRAVEFAIARAAFEMRQQPPNGTSAKAAFQRALQLDPWNVQLRLQFASALEALGEAAAAADQYREALRIDDLLPAGEPKRLPIARRGAIEAKLAVEKPR